MNKRTPFGALMMQLEWPRAIPLFRPGEYFGHRQVNDFALCVHESETGSGLSFLLNSVAFSARNQIIPHFSGYCR